MVTTTASALAWLGAATTRLLACQDEDGLVMALDDEVRRGCGVDRVHLALVDERHGTWYWALRCDEHGRPYRETTRRPLETFDGCMRLDRFAGGATVAYTPDPATPPALARRRPSDGADGAVREALDVLLRCASVPPPGTPERRQLRPETGTGARGHPDAAERRTPPVTVGLLSVDNLPSVRPLLHDLDGAALADVLAVFGQILAQALGSARLRRLESEARNTAEHHAAREAALAEIAGLVGVALNPTIVAQRTAASVRAVVAGVEQVWLWMLSDDRRALKAIAMHGAPGEAIAAWSTLPLPDESSIVARVLDCLDVGLHDGPVAGAYSGPLASGGRHVVLPLTSPEGVVGALAIIGQGQGQGHGQRPHSFSSEDRAFLQATASHVGTALANARFVSQQRRSAARSERLLDLARSLSGLDGVAEIADCIARLAPAILGCDHGGVYLLAADGRQYVPAATSGPLALTRVDWLMEAAPVDRPALRPLLAGNPVLLDDQTGRPVPVDSSPRAATLLLPLCLGARALGFISIADARRGHHFTAEEIALGRGMAHHAAMAIETARLRVAAAHAVAVEEADRLKDELLSTVSHELRTPLGAIKGFATALLEYEGSIEPDERRQFLQMIDGAADRLRGMVDDLLQAGSLDAGRLRLHPAPLDLAALLRDTLHSMSPRLACHTIHLDVARDRAPIVGDAARLRQVLQNLVDNAAKYSPEHSAIRLSIKHDDGEVRLAVADQGIGVPPEHLPRIFERFHRVDSSLTRSVGGTGLGLAIARGIVEAHGGRIWAESEGENRGTTITVALPAACAGQPVVQRVAQSVPPGAEGVAR